MRVVWLIGILFCAGVPALSALGQKETPPALPGEAPPPTVLAPANADAIQKSLTVPFSPQAAPGRVLMSWTFMVYDAAGRVVWSKTETQTKDRGFFGELFNLGLKPAVDVPPQLVWDGSDAGKPAADGVYTYVVSVTDSAGQTTRTPPYTLTIQNSPVRITKLRTDYTVFSPRGKRNTLTILQGGTREPRWEGTLVNAAGAPVRTFVWENPGQASADQTPPDVIWDGKDDSGQILPEGDYQYTLRGTNRAGVVAVQALDHLITISERPGILRLSSDQPSFSPLADKNWPSVLTLRADSGNDEGLTDWTVTVSDPARPKTALWSKSGKAPLPPAIVFDGRDLVGRTLPDGRYQAILSANFANGNSGESPAYRFEVDTVAPQGTLKSAWSVFGGPGRPVLGVDFVGDGNVEWTLEAREAARLVRPVSLGTMGKVTVAWPPAEAGTLLADGTYTLWAWAHDEAGNLGTAELPVQKDTRPRKVSLVPSARVLVPGDRENGKLTLRPEVDFGNTVEKSEWTLTLPETQGSGSRTVLLTTTGPVSVYDWTGQDGVGQSLADGAYRVTLAVTWKNGATATAQQDLRIDSEYLKKPKGSLSASALLFGGSERPSVTVQFEGDPDLAWTLELKDAAGKVRALYPLGTTGSASVVVPGPVDGALADGAYTLTASAKSRAGVAGTAVLALQKDSRPAKASLDLSRTVLVPGKGSAAQLRITPLLSLVDSVERTTFRVVSNNGAVWAERSADGLLTFWDWNGLSSSGDLPPDGTYTVDLEVAYSNGSLAKAASELRVDSSWLTEPQGSLTVSSPVFGSSVRPVVSATFTGDPGPVWTLDVVDKTGKSLRQYVLGGTGSAVVEVGADANGRSLPDGSYTLKATAKNPAGLLGTATATVQKDSRPLNVSLDLSSPVLVPGNSLNGSVKITPVLNILDAVVATTLSITGPDGKPVDEKTWDGLIPFWDWEGKDSQGKRSPDGAYRIRLRVSYANGGVGEASQTLKVDSTYLKEPQGTLTASDTVFGGSGRTGVTISFQGNPGLSWSLEVLDKDGKTIRKDPLGTTGEASWDFQGLDAQNKPLPDRPYTLKASTVSVAGVPGTALLQLQKDSREGKVSLDLSRTIIVPGRGPTATVRITPLLEVVDSVERTVLTVLGPDGKTVGEKSGDGFLPFWDWDGKDPQGKNLPNGAYQVALTVNYANGSTARSRSELKIDSTYLNDSGPLVEMTLSSKTFAPNNVDGPTDLTVSIKTTEGVVPVSGWQMVVLDPRGKTFRQWSGKGLPPKTVYWDGKGDAGDVVESGEDYQLQLRVTDTQNHVTRKQETVTIDISVIKLAEGRYKIIVSSIQFAGYSSDVFKVQGDLLTKNLYILKRLANALSKFPGYKIRLEGYAVSEYWNDPKSAEKEQKTQLLPLSLDRAQAVKSVMVLLGIDTERFTVQGFGGDKPLVPHGDLENRWKNRRVEFYLDKN